MTHQPSDKSDKSDKSIERVHSTSELHSKLTESSNDACLGFQKKTTNCIQLSIAFLFLIVVGGVVFYLIEAPHEDLRIQQVLKVYGQNKAKILQLLHHNSTANTSPEELYALLQPHVIGFHDGPQYTNNWTFLNALIFSFTIITTIGYGTFTPSTIAGQIFLVVYSCFAIPLSGIALACIAERALYVFTLISMVGQDKTLQAFRAFDEDDSGELDKEEFLQAVGLLLDIDLNTNQQNKLWNKVDDDGSGSVDLDEFKWAINYMHADVTESAGRKNRIKVTLIGIIVWICIGISVFCWIENWDVAKSFYFCSVSLLTIGLGDVFPTSTGGLIFLLVFAMIGLGLIAVLLTLIEGTLRDLEEARTLAASVKKHKEVIHKLRECILFRRMSGKELDGIISKMSKEVFAKGTVVVNEKTPCTKFFLVLQGSVLLQQEGLGWDKLLNAPSFFGEQSLLKKESMCDASVLVETEVQAMTLDRADFLGLVNNGGVKLSNGGVIHDIQLVVDGGGGSS